MRTITFATLVLIAFAAVAEESRSGELLVSATPVDPAVLEKRRQEEEAQLRRNLNQMRRVLEQENAQADAVARGSTGGIRVNPSDSPSLGTMREQLATQMERLEDRCFGLEAKAENGNVIVICGDNAGRADNTNIRSNDTILALPPVPEPAPAAPATPATTATPDTSPTPTQPAGNADPVPAVEGAP